MSNKEKSIRRKVNPNIISVIFLFVFLVFGKGAAEAATIYVPGDYGTIQEAIDAAIDSDEVIVSASGGPYLENLTFDGTKSITVKTTDGAVIDGNTNGSVVTFTGGDSSTFEGFTLTNGNGTVDGAEIRGGGIFCRESSPTITNCIINGNLAETTGGGIYCDSNSSPIISNCTINNNSAKSGGGIFCSNSSSPSITNCIISDNSVNNYGGGGIFCTDSSSPTITNCIISGNSAMGEWGGGIYCRRSSPTITNCTISGNSANENGGGIYFWDSPSPMIINCTISGNSANGSGGGIWCYESTLTVVNSILWENAAGGNPNAIDLSDTNSSTTITYSDIDSSLIAGIGTSTLSDNINLDPLFVDGRLASDAPTTAGDYHLQSSSPCIDTGTDDIGTYPDLPVYDVDGDSRPLDGNGDGTHTRDMGADEYPFAVTTTTVTPNPDNTTPQQGDTICIKVNVADVADLYGTDLDLIYNPAVLDYTDTTEGDFLNQDGQPTIMLAEPLNGDEVNGQIVVGVTRQGDVGGVSGSGTLATFCFQVIGGYCSTSNISLGNAYLEGPVQDSIITATWNDTVVDVMLASLSNPVASDPGLHNQIDLSWNVVSGADEYDIYRSNNSGGSFELIGTTTAISYSDTDCIITTMDYYYKVRAVSGGTCFSEFSAEVSGIADGLLGDINIDNRADGRDLSRVARAFGASSGDARFDCQADLDRTNLIDGDDLSLLAASFGQTL